MFKSHLTYPATLQKGHVVLTGYQPGLATMCNGARWVFISCLVLECGCIYCATLIQNLIYYEEIALLTGMLFYLQVLEDTLERIEESFTCCVCRDAQVSAALCPCGHLACIECAKRLSECPLCRKQINTVQRIFLPTIQVEGATCASISLQTVMESPGHRHCHKRKRET